MLRAALEGDIGVAARCFLAASGREFPTPEELVTAHLAARVAFDIHTLRRALTEKG